MTLLKVCQFGDDVLKTKSKELNKKEILSNKIKYLVMDMIETMYAGNGVGIAAPQVGINKKLMIIDVGWAQEQVAKPMIFINPEIIEAEGEILSEEGCLSFKSAKDKNKKGVLIKDIKRFKRVKVKYQDMKAKEQFIDASDNLLSRCLQHEIDHLNGIVFIERAQDQEEVQKQLTEYGFSKYINKLNYINS